jgi:hypothetical protein
MMRLATLILGVLLSSRLAAGATATQPSATQPDPYAGNACVSCHRDLPGRSSEIVDLEWRQSVHYGAKVGCDGCHGGDASVRREQFPNEDAFKAASHMDRNPEFLAMQGQQFVSAARGRSVSYFCGKCHAKIKESHLGSPHGEFGDPTCLYCHGQGSHKITPASTQIIDTRERAEAGRCSPCHRSGTMQAVARIKQTLDDAEQQITASGQLYAELEEWGYRSLRLEQLHHHAKEVRSELRQVFHSFDMREINNFAAEIQAAVERTQSTHELVQHLRRSQRQQTLVGLGATILLLLFASLLLYYKRTFLEHHSAPSGASDK